MNTISGSYRYLIVGAGIAGAAASRGIRTVDPDGSIGLFGTEPDAPIYRPDLSKTLWWKPVITLKTSALSIVDADLHTNTTVVAIDPERHQVRLEDGGVVGYERLLLATGAAPRTTDLAPGPRVLYFRTVADYRALRTLAPAGSHVVVVGGGYIGSEIASALCGTGVSVTMIMDTDLIQERMFPPGLAATITEDFARRGVRLVHGSVSGGSTHADSVTVRLTDGREFTGNAAVIGIGVVPRTGLAEAAGLRLDAASHGIEVDEQLRTSAPDVYAVGDVASYPDSRLGRRRVEHVDAAETMGRMVGANMAGAERIYEHTPYFWSDLFEAGYEAIGETDTRHEMVEDFADDTYGTGVVYYLDGGAVRGVLLWNVWDSIELAQAVIEETARVPVDPASLKGRIPLK